MKNIALHLWALVGYSVATVGIIIMILLELSKIISFPPYVWLADKAIEGVEFLLDNFPFGDKIV